MKMIHNLLEEWLSNSSRERLANFISRRNPTSLLFLAHPPRTWIGVGNTHMYLQFPTASPCECHAFPSSSPAEKQSCFSLLLSDTCLFPDLVALLPFRDTNVTTGSETPCSALNMAENKSMYWVPLTGLPSKSGWCAQLWAKFPAISHHVPCAMVFGNAGDSSFIPLLVTKRLQAKLQYPTCFVTTALQGHPWNRFSYRDPRILLKDRVA